MIERILSFLAYGLFCACIGWYYHGHPDKFIQHTGFIGSYIVERLEHVQKCPENYSCSLITPTYAPKD